MIRGSLQVGSVRKEAGLLTSFRMPWRVQACVNLNYVQEKKIVLQNHLSKRYLKHDFWAIEIIMPSEKLALL